MMLLISRNCRRTSFTTERRAAHGSSPWRRKEGINPPMKRPMITRILQLELESGETCLGQTVRVVGEQHERRESGEPIASPS